MRKTFFLLIFNVVFVARSSTSSSSSSLSTMTPTMGDVVVAFVNDTVTFDCDAEHSDDHVMWKKSATQVVVTADAGPHIQHQNSKSFPFDATQKKRHRRNKHSGSGKLTLPGIDSGDSGTYSCHSLHRDRPTLRSWTLIVLETSDLSTTSGSIFYQGLLLKVSSFFYPQPLLVFTETIGI